MEVLSAKAVIVEFGGVGMSIVNNPHISGPSTLSCGTPDPILKKSDVSSFTLIWKDLFSKKIF